MLPATTPDAGEDAIRRVLTGDIDAYAEVVRAHETAVRRWLWPRCPPGVDVDEITHRTFIKAYLELGGYTPGTQFRAWVTAIARFQLLAECKRLRRRAGARISVDGLILEAQESEAQEPSAALEGRLGALQACLASIHASGRDLLEQRYTRGLSVAAIAAASGRTVGAIKTSLCAVRRKLQECINRRLAGEP